MRWRMLEGHPQYRGLPRVIAYFYYPSSTEEYLGVANGLVRCGSMAHSFSASKNLSGNRGWGYICCMKAKGSECYEKHR